MGTNKIPIDNVNEAKLSKILDGSPVCRFTTAWVLTNLGFFGIYLSIIRPEPEQSKSNRSLRRSEAKRILKEIADAIKLLEEELR